MVDSDWIGVRFNYSCSIMKNVLRTHCIGCESWILYEVRLICHQLCFKKRWYPKLSFHSPLATWLCVRQVGRRWIVEKGPTSQFPWKSRSVGWQERAWKFCWCFWGFAVPSRSVCGITLHWLTLLLIIRFFWLFIFALSWSFSILRAVLPHGFVVCSFFAFSLSMVIRVIIQSFAVVAVSRAMSCNYRFGSGDSSGEHFKYLSVHVIITVSCSLVSFRTSTRSFPSYFHVVFYQTLISPHSCGR